MAESLPYAAASVIYVDEGRIVYAVWTSDAALAADPQIIERLADPSTDLEVIAEAEKFTKASGSTESGWVVRAGRNALEPLARKPAALAQLRAMVADHFDWPANP